ncbi:MAG: EAL domain-containing protein [Rhodospirillales bacterium]|nr:EAL domain-containing protein [Rhodospirillales bacterium]
MSCGSRHARFAAMMPLSRDRLLAFAFAPAELLVALAPDATIAWAAGAFPARFGAPAERFVGAAIDRLIAAPDRAVVAAALRAAMVGGRVPPMRVRLADAACTPFALAALALPGTEPLLCVSLGPLPVAPAMAAPEPAPVPSLRALMEARLRTGQPAVMGMLDVPEGAPDPSQTIREIAGTVALGPVAPGRYGVLTETGLDFGQIVAAVETLVRAAGGDAAAVRGSSLALDAGSLSPVQAVQALRLALVRFARGGAAAVGSGLASLVADAGAEAQAIRRVIAERRFRLAFQPVVALVNGTLHHHEALLRPDPIAAGPQSTQEFVTVAEAVGLAEALDLAVLAEVLAQLVRVPGTKLAANISGLSLQSPAFRSRLLDLLRAHDGGALLIEFTETAEIDDFPAAAETVRSLRAAGIPVCLDDFGAGGAGFRYLREFQADFVKIDGAFVRRAEHSARDRDIVAAMIEAAQRVDAAIIAEMVETEAQARLMRALGVTYGQGWLFGRPRARTEMV